MQESDHEAVELRYTPMVETFDGDSRCFLVALDSWQIALIQSVLRYAYWPARWADLGETSISDVLQRVAETERCLMSGCEVADLVTAIENGFQQLHEDITGQGGESGPLTLIGDDVKELEDDLAEVWGVLQVVATIMGAVVGEPVPPL
jgi:hypothetical protein